MSSQDRVQRGAPAAVSPSRATGGAASTIANWTETANWSATAEPAQDGSNGGGGQDDG
jgi:hypothetical protein